MQVGSIRVEQSLRLLFDRPCLIHWGMDNWQDVTDVTTVPGFLGLQIADLATEEFGVGRRNVVSMQERKTGTRIEHDRSVVIAAGEPS